MALRFQRIAWLLDEPHQDLLDSRSQYQTPSAGGHNKEKFRRGNYEISFHAEKERYAEDISLAHFEMAISCGVILKD